MSYVGLVPSECSSGQSRRQGSITKAGNGHVRRLLVEAAWHQRQRPRVGAALAARQRGQDPLVLERAWRAQQRLHRRWGRMAARGKPHQKIVVATARELAGFVWAIATDQPLRSTWNTNHQPAWAEAADAPTDTENPRRLYAALPAGDPRP